MKRFNELDVDVRRLKKNKQFIKTTNPEGVTH